MEIIVLPEIFYIIGAINISICLIGIFVTFSLALYIAREETMLARLLACLFLSQALVIASVGNVAVGTFLQYTYNMWALHLAVQGMIIAFNIFALWRFYKHFRWG